MYTPWRMNQKLSCLLLRSIFDFLSTIMDTAMVSDIKLVDGKGFNMSTIPSMNNCTIDTMIFNSTSWSLDGTYTFNSSINIQQCVEFGQIMSKDASMDCTSNQNTPIIVEINNSITYADAVRTSTNKQINRENSGQVLGCPVGSQANQCLLN